MERNGTVFTSDPALLRSPASGLHVPMDVTLFEPHKSPCQINTFVHIEQYPQV